jgi:hypothetical protein
MQTQEGIKAPLYDKFNLSQLAVQCVFWICVAAVVRRVQDDNSDLGYIVLLVILPSIIGFVILHFIVDVAKIYWEAGKWPGKNYQIIVDCDVDPILPDFASGIVKHQPGGQLNISAIKDIWKMLWKKCSEYEPKDGELRSGMAGHLPFNVNALYYFLGNQELISRKGWEFYTYIYFWGTTFMVGEDEVVLGLKQTSEKYTLIYQVINGRWEGNLVHSAIQLK